MKRTLTVFILSLLLISTGTIHANSNPTKSFASWYSSVFQLKAEKLGSVTATGLITGIAGFNKFVKESKKSLGIMIVDLSGDRVKEAQSNIKAHQSDMIENLNETIAELQKESFDEYLEERNIEAEISREVEKMLEELLNE